MADDIKIIADIKEVEALSRKYPEASLAAIKRRLQEGLLLLERAIKLLTPEGAGPIHIRDTIFQKLEASSQSAWGLVGTPAVYGEPLERGTRAHFPPVKPILFWVERKLGLTGKEAKSAAFCIARAISRRGTKGAHMFERGFGDNENRVLEILNRIPEDIVKAVTA